MKGITVVSPMWGERKITDRMVFSILHQYIGKRNPFKIHLVLVDDYIEGRLENGDSYYKYYESEEFKDFYDPEVIKITIIKNEEHKYQGESREIGFLAGDYPYFVLIDCDDMFAPNALDRYVWAIKQNSKQRGLPIAYIGGMTYGFDSGQPPQIIPGQSIWVQGRCYNRDFILKHDIHFPTGTNSRQGEDYPFINKVDYAVEHDPGYQVIQLFGEENQQCTTFWFPNPNSLSRQDPHYGQHLSGWTMKSSAAILDFFEEYNEKNDLSIEEDEYLKMRSLDMTIYSFYNLLDFIREVASTDYEPLEEDWYALRDACAYLRKKLKENFWDEICYSDVEDKLYQVKHFSDVRFCESWIGTFYDYINNKSPILSMDYDAMIDYAKGLEFDSAGHETNSPQVIAWQKRHKEHIDKMKEGVI